MIRRSMRWILDDGGICLSNNAAERTVRGIAVGRRKWTFCGSGGPTVNVRLSSTH
jgi:Transposase IS66 family